MRAVAGQRFLNELNMGHLPESAANINIAFSNIEQNTLTAVQNDLDSLEQNNVIIQECESEEMLYSPQSPLVGCDSDSDGITIITKSLQN